MNIFILIVFIVIIAVLGALLFLSNRKVEAKQQEFNRIIQDKQHEFNQKLESKQQEYDVKSEAKQQEFNKTIDSKQQELRDLVAERAALQQRLDFLEQEQKQLAEDSKLVFSKVASDLLEKHGKTLRESSQQQISQLLNPLSANLEQLKKSINDYSHKQVEYSTALKQQIEDLDKMNQSIGKEAKELSNALRSNSKTQGDWGEMILTRILENSGLVEGTNYHLQVTHNTDGSLITNDQGKALRPDVVIHLPDGKNLVIDSKVSLTAYTQWANEEDEQLRKEHLKEHLNSVKRHIDELQNKRYEQWVKDAADFVMLFIPNEAAYLQAMQADNDLWQYAYKRNVVIVSPTHLISSVKLIDQLWTRERQNKNALQIAEEAGKMLDKFVTFAKELEDIDDDLIKARKHYDGAMNKLKTGKGNLVSRAQKVQQLGAKATKPLPTPPANPEDLLVP
ncbi:MAG: DNA recombination protein RmuC [Muribaculaceae bacterium]|nr:DNA recombination protein RmuC [Muribaculaceae bacterium]